MDAAVIMAKTVSRILDGRAKKSGLPPGSLVFIGEKKCEKARITVIDYDEKSFKEKEVKTLEECFEFRDTPTVSWINIDCLHDLNVIESIGKFFNIHPLVLEDIVNTKQRPKMEDFGDYIYIVMRILSYDEKKDVFESEQASIILAQNFLISFQERPGDPFDPIRGRIRENKGKIRKMGTDYLAYSLIDATVDNYFLILEKIGEKIEILEERLVAKPSPETLRAIHKIKREMIFLRKSVWPLREVVAELNRGESFLITRSTSLFLRDVYDHTIQVIDTIETFRDILAGMIDIYLSSISNKLNEVMKVLTIISTIFIPLTFIASIYGMNFKYMPELDRPEGYAVIISIMAVIAAIMILYFKRKKWF